MSEPSEPTEPLPGKNSLSSARGKPLVPVWVRVGIYLLIIGLVAAVAVPNFRRVRTTASVNHCIVNLKNMNRAVQQWAAAGGKQPGDLFVEADLAPYLPVGGVRPCPAGGAYQFGPAVSNGVTCTLGVTIGHTM